MTVYFLAESFNKITFLQAIQTKFQLDMILASNKKTSIIIIIIV